MELNLVVEGLDAVLVIAPRVLLGYLDRIDSLDAPAALMLDRLWQNCTFAKLCFVHPVYRFYIPSYSILLRRRWIDINYRATTLDHHQEPSIERGPPECLAPTGCDHQSDTAASGPTWCPCRPSTTHHLRTRRFAARPACPR